MNNKNIKSLKFKIEELSEKSVGIMFATFEAEDKADAYNEIIKPTAFNSYLAKKNFDNTMADLNHLSFWGDISNFWGAVLHKPIVDSKGITAICTFNQNKEGILTPKAEFVRNFLRQKAEAKMKVAVSFNLKDVKRETLESGVTLITKINKVPEISVLMGEDPANPFAGVMNMKSKETNKIIDSFNLMNAKLELLINSVANNETAIKSLLDNLEDKKIAVIAKEAMLNSDNQPHETLKQVEGEVEEEKSKIVFLEQFNDYLNNK